LALKHPNYNPKGRRPMKPLNAILSATGLVLALSLPSWAQEVKQLPTQTVTLSGTVNQDWHVVGI